MKRFSTGAIPGHNVAIGAQPDEDGPLCLYEDHVKAVHEAEQEALMANDCMGMIHDHLKLRLGEDMKSTPAMMYPEAIDHAICLHRDKAVKEDREQTLAKLRELWKLGD